MSRPSTVGAQRRWELEYLLDSPGQLGLAHADARYHGNRSAGDALRSLDRAIAQLPVLLEHSDAGDDAST